VLTGVVGGEAGRERLAARRATFLMDGLGVRCVSDRPWVTPAETAECAMAHLAVGERSITEELFSWTRRHREDNGRYWTGTVYPDGSRFPPGEQSTYTSAAIVLCADAIADHSPAARLFVEHDTVVPEIIDIDDFDNLDGTPGARAV
jgi:hypothetical protein